MPAIWFDLHDFYRFLTQPAGPYLYSSWVRINRTDNPNFINNLNPGPVRDMTTVRPSGWRAQPNDLSWAFYTKFFVDSPAAPLPPGFTRFETSADIRFAPTGGGQGFADHFSDNSPRYFSPIGSSLWALSTNPYGFRTEHTIMQPGVLQWDARLRLSMPNADIPARIEYFAPPEIPDVSAFRAELARLGVRLRDPALGEPARTYRVTFAASGTGRYTATWDEISENGTPAGTRRFTNVTSALAVPLTALSLSILLGIGQDLFGSSSAQHVEVAGSQRVRFDSSSQ